MRRSLTDEGTFSPGRFHTGGANVLFGDGSVRCVFVRFVAGAMAAMPVGADNEDWTNLPGVPLTTVPTTKIFNFAHLAATPISLASAGALF